MAYTTIDDPTAFFQTTLYTGNGAGSHAIDQGGNSTFQPDWLWIKKRNAAVNHLLHDSVRGVTNLLVSNTNAGDDSNSNIVLGFDSDGFRVGANSASNGNGDTFVAWQWKAGTSFTNDASSTSVGSIDSAGSVSTAAGFSIISYTGTGSAGTIAHGLGVKPAMIIFKNRSRATNWLVYHKDIAATKFLYLNVTDAVGTDSGHFNDTEPTSTVFSVGGANGTNYNGENLIAYCFAEKKGYSKFGSYTGNGNADGTFVYTGFKPAFIMTKQTDGVDWWVINDTKRDIHNPTTLGLYVQENNAETSDDAWTKDILSNGFKHLTTNSGSNGSGNAYIYMAFAENPFVTSTGVPATAR